MDEVRKSNRGPSAAAENRAAIIAAAGQLLAEGGYDVPLSAIARRAGVGQGSLYRHFPDRISLALAVFAENVEALGAVAEEKGATLGTVLAAIADQAVASSAFIELLHTSRQDSRVVGLAEDIGRILERLLDEDRRAGRVAAELSSQDVMVAVAMVGSAIGAEDPARRAETAVRALRLVSAAFRP